MTTRLLIVLLPKFKNLLSSIIGAIAEPVIFWNIIAIDIKQKSIAAWVIYIEYDSFPAYWNGFIFKSWEKIPDSKEKKNTVIKNDSDATIDLCSNCDWTIKTIDTSSTNSIILPKIYDGLKWGNFLYITYVKAPPKKHDRPLKTASTNMLDPKYIRTKANSDVANQERILLPLKITIEKKSNAYI